MVTSAVTECCSASGGRVKVAINGVVLPVRSVSIIPMGMDRSAQANQDGSIYTIVKPIPPEINMKLSDGCGLDLSMLYLCEVNVTVELIDVRRVYLMTRGKIVGKFELNTETGEISGVKIVGHITQMNLA